MPFRPHHVRGGDYLLVPRTTHVVLTTLSIICGLLLWIPSLFLMKKSFVFLTGYGTLALATGLLLWIQAIPRQRRRYVEKIDPQKSNTWFRVPNSSDVGVGVVALLASILCGIGGAQLTSDVIHCPDQTPQSLAQLIFGANLNVTAVTDWTAQYRNPYFATSVLTYQSCLDDYAWLIYSIVMYFITALVMIAVAVVQYMIRDWTIEVLMRQQKIQEDLLIAKRIQAVDTAQPQQVVTVGSGRLVGAPTSVGGQSSLSQTLQIKRLVRIHLMEEIGIGSVTYDDDEGDDNNDYRSTALGASMILPGRQVLA